MFLKLQNKTVITKEYPLTWKEGMNPFYPINTAENQKKYLKYKEKAKEEKNLFFAGRLGAYRYMDMDQTVWEALQLYQILK